jgi:hypothetical protein
VNLIKLFSQILLTMQVVPPFLEVETVEWCFVGSTGLVTNGPGALQ